MPGAVSGSSLILGGQCCIRVPTLFVMAFVPVLSAGTGSAPESIDRRSSAADSTGSAPTFEQAPTAVVSAVDGSPRLPLAASSPCGLDTTPPLCSTKHGSVRWYAIWHVPGRPNLHGVVRATEPNAWKKVEEWLPDGRYANSGSKLQRFQSYEAAVQGYRRECKRWGVPWTPAVHEM